MMFQKILMAIFFTFTLILGIVLVKAYSKPSGSTNLTMSEIHEIRMNAYK